jgi:transcriptional regulator of arginine metabolism
MLAKARRRQHILDILATQSVPSQDRLQALLAQRGVDVTQATLSRDLRDLNVLKGPSGYVLGNGNAEKPDDHPMAEQAVKSYMLACNPAASLVVLKTRPGHANALALELDRAGFSGAAGTIAGDDTVFVAASSPARAKSLVRLLRAMADR